MRMCGSARHRLKKRNDLRRDVLQRIFADMLGLSCGRKPDDDRWQAVVDDGNNRHNPRAFTPLRKRSFAPQETGIKNF